MGFFDRFYYGKAGKRDYSEMDMPKTRVSLFFLVLKERFFDIVKLNMLQLVFWLPFLIWTYINFVAIQSIDAQTLLAAENGAQQYKSMLMSYVMMWLIGIVPCIAITGPSSAGAAYVTRNWARDQHAFMFSDFKDAFKSNWKQALPVSLLTSVVPVLAFTAISYYSNAASENMLLMMPMIVVISATMMWTLMLPLLYPMMVGYELRLKDIIKNAFIMSAARFPRMVLARLITLIPIAVLFAGLFVGNGIVVLVIVFYYLLFGFAFSRLVYASFANGIFDRYLNPHIEGAEVRAGLRPLSEEDELLDDEDDEEEDEDEEI